MSDEDLTIEERVGVEPHAPPSTFTIWTLKSTDGSQSTQIGGATDLPSACALAAAAVQIFRTGIGVYNPGLVAYLRMPQTTTPP